MLVLLVLDGTLSRYYVGKDRQELLDNIGKRFITSNIKCPPDRTKSEWIDYRLKNNAEISFLRDIALLFENNVNQQIFYNHDPNVRKSLERNNIPFAHPPVGVINVQ